MGPTMVTKLVKSCKSVYIFFADVLDMLNDDILSINIATYLKKLPIHNDIIA